jgi:hypothetical protein
MPKYNIYFMQKSKQGICAVYIGQVDGRDERHAEVRASRLCWKIRAVGSEYYHARDPKHDDWHRPLKQARKEK